MAAELRLEPTRVVGTGTVRRGRARRLRRAGLLPLAGVIADTTTCFSSGVGNDPVDRRRVGAEGEPGEHRHSPKRPVDWQQA